MGKARTSSNTRVTPLLPQINTGFTDRPSNPSHIRVFDVDIENGKLSNGKVFEEMPKPSITMACAPTPTAASGAPLDGAIRNGVR